MLGLVLDALMGIVGALPQLIQGIIADCLSGLPQPLPTLTGSVPRDPVAASFDFIRRSNRHALAIYCDLIVGAMIVKGFFRSGHAGFSSAFPAKSNTTCETICSTSLVRLEPEYYVRNRTGDLMSRATNDLNNVRDGSRPGHHVHGDDDCDVRGRTVISW